MLNQIYFIFRFLIEPASSRSFDKKGQLALLNTYGIYFLLMFGYIFVLRYADRFLDLPPHRVFEIVKGNTTATIILHGMIIAPIFEELAFRLPLKYSRVNLSVSLVAILFYTNLYTYNVSLVYFAPMSIALSLGFYYALKKNSQLNHGLSRWWGQNSRPIIWFSILAFGIMHTRNYQSWENIAVLPLIICPQLIMGLLLSFLRFRFNIFYSIFGHFLINSTLLSIVLLAIK